MKTIRIRIVLALLLILCMVSMPASAHRVYVKEQVTGVQVKAWYGGGDPMAGANVEIYANTTNGEELYLKDKTDEKGIFQFKPKLGVSGYRVVVEATGHRAEKTFNLMSGSGQEAAELPLFARVLAGFGYLAGFAGIAMILAARKMKKQYENK